jgi:outer membrane lipoprotein carrier protein
MRWTAWCVATLFLTLSAAAETPLASVPQAVEKHYNTLRSLKAQFEESVSASAARAPRRQERGTVYLLRPRKMRWEYSDPPGKLFVSDGKMFYLYSPNSNQVQKIPPKQAEDLRAPLAFLLGKLDFQKEFGKILVQSTPEGILLTADAKGDQDPYTQVVFTIAPQNFEIRRIVVNGQDGLITTFTFSGEIDNPPLQAALLSFQPPPGAEVVEAAH